MCRADLGGSLVALFVLLTQHEPLLLHCANFFSALSKLRSCQPTKELQAVKCRRMRIITSLLYSVESTSSQILPAILILSTSAGERQRKWSVPLPKRRVTALMCRKNMDNPDEQALWCNYKAHPLTRDLLNRSEWASRSRKKTLGERYNQSRSSSWTSS